jgi:hypothetical protein
MYFVSNSVNRGYNLFNILTDANRTIISPFITLIVAGIQQAARNAMSTIQSYFKVQIFKSSDYLDYIRTLKCIACDSKHGIVEAHHESFGYKAMGKNLIPDSQTLPLCNYCHVPKRHTWGYHTFWDFVNVDPKMIVINQLTDYLLLCGKEKKR